MSVGFLVEFVNNTAFTLSLQATVGSSGDWDSSTATRPDIDLKNSTVAAFSKSRAFHEERANYRSSAPFTVTAAFSNGQSFSFTLDGCDAENLARNGEVVVIGGARDYAVYQMTSHASEAGGEWPKITVFITARVSGSRWMERALSRNPNLTLPQLTIPGTHESGTAGGNGEMGTRCQTLYIARQLALGVRFLDLRVRPYPSEQDLGIFHARYTQNLWLGKQVLPVVSQFLIDNPNECVVLCFERAVGSDGPFDELLKDLLLGNPDKGIPRGVPAGKLYSTNDASNLKLADLKGSVVLLRRDPEATLGIRLPDWKDDDDDQTIQLPGKTLRIQDAYEYSQVQGSYIAAAKWKNVKKMLEFAKSDPSTWFINFTSASHTPPTLNAYPWDVASGQWGVNALLARYLASQAPFRGRLGMIVMDYPEEPGGTLLSQLLIAMNEQL